MQMLVDTIATQPAESGSFFLLHCLSDFNNCNKLLALTAVLLFGAILPIDQ